MNTTRRGITIPDLISIGVYSALYFLLVGVAALATVFLLPGYSFLFIPVLSALISGTVFMLLASKVPKFGAITLMASVMGVFFFISGRFPFALIPSIVIGLAADVIALIFRYKSKNGLLLSYVVFSYSTIGPIIPFFFFPEYYINDLVERGRDMTYIEGAFADITNNTLIIIVAGIALTAVIGGIFGQRMMKKHFVKAGIV